MVRLSLLALLLLSIFTCCDPCTGCGPVTYEPTVALRFVDVELNDEDEPVQTAEDSVFIHWVALDTTLHLPNRLDRMALPLLITDERTDYEVTLNETPASFALVYALSEQMDVDRRMLLRALDIEMVDHPFDSVVYACGLDGCIDKQTQITCYY